MDSATNLETFHYDLKEIRLRALDILRGNREYRRLQEQKMKLDPRRDLLMLSQVEARMNQMEAAETMRLTQLEEDRRKDVNRIGELLEGISPEAHARYQDLMSAVSLLMDSLDTVFSELNRVLKDSRVGIQMQNFPELMQARRLAWEMASGEQGMMPGYKADLMAVESDLLHDYLMERAGAFRRAVDVIERQQ